MPTFQEVFTSNALQPICKPAQNYPFTSFINRIVTADLIHPTGPYNRALQLPKVPVVMPYNPNAEIDIWIVNRICNELDVLRRTREPRVFDFLDRLFKAGTSINLQQVQHFCCGLTPPLAGTPPKYDYTQIDAQFGQLLRDLVNKQRDLLPDAEIAAIEKAFAALEAQPNPAHSSKSSSGAKSSPNLLTSYPQSVAKARQAATQTAAATASATTEEEDDPEFVAEMTALYGPDFRNLFT